MRKLLQNSLFEGIEYDEWTMYTDGACKGNPGPSSIGIVLMDGKGITMAEISEAIGIATNNEAEYRALLRGLQEAQKFEVKKLIWITDSELLAKQWSGEYQIKSPNLKPLYQSAKLLAEKFDVFKVQHTLREGNKVADKLANEAFNSNSIKQKRR